MTLQIPARVHQTTTTVGLSTYDLVDSASQFSDYRNYYTDGSTVPWCVSDASGFEIGSGILTYGVVDTITRLSVLASSNGGAAVNWGAGVKDVFVWRVNGSELTPQEFGAKGDGVTDDAVALNAWFAAVLATELPGRLISWYKSASQIVWDFTSKATGAFKITGNGPNRCGILFANDVAGPNFKVLSSSGAGFYPVMRDFSIHGNTNGILAQIGDPANVATNEMIYEGIEHKNSNVGSSTVALALAALYNCQLFVVANCGGKATGRAAILANSAVGAGAVAFCKIAGSCGNANTGIEWAGGYVYANSLVAIDIEECMYCMGGASANIGTNDISGGTFVYDTAAFNFTAWNGYQYWSGSGVNLAPNLGGPTFAVGSKITVVLHGKDYSITPAVPASGVAVRNTTPNHTLVTVTSLVDNPLTSATITNPDEAGQNIVLTMPSGTFSLAPGERVALAYSAAAPSWLWRAVL